MFPREVWKQTGHHKTIWCIVLLAALFTGMGIVATIVYIVRVRPKLGATRGPRRGRGGLR
jgi:hypothetical protein